MNKLIQQLDFEQKPISLYSVNQQPAFLASEIGGILGLSNPRKTIRESKALQEGLDYDLIPADSVIRGNKKFPLIGEPTLHGKVYVLYPSGLFLFIIRSNKPISIPFTRWVIREAIPLALGDSPGPDIPQYKPADRLKLMVLAEKGNPYAKADLKKLGYRAQTEQLTLPGGQDA